MNKMQQRRLARGPAMVRLLSYYGSQKRLAARLGVSRSAVCQWVSSEHVPPRRALQIEEQSHGLIKAKTLIKEGLNV